MCKDVTRVLMKRKVCVNSSVHKDDICKEDIHTYWEHEDGEKNQLQPQKNTSLRSEALIIIVGRLKIDQDVDVDYESYSKQNQYPDHQKQIHRHQFVNERNSAGNCYCVRDITRWIQIL